MVRWWEACREHGRHSHDHDNSEKKAYLGFHEISLRVMVHGFLIICVHGVKPFTMIL